MKSTDSVIVSWDFSRGKDVGVLIVGSQKNGRVDVINAYQGGVQFSRIMYPEKIMPRFELSCYRILEED